MVQTRKLSFQEAWQSTTVFLVDNELEEEIDRQADDLLAVATSAGLSPDSPPLDIPAVGSLLAQHSKALDVLLCDIDLSEEKLKRIISLLRRIGRIAGGFETEWSITRIKSKLAHEPDFALMVAGLLMDGIRDPQLAQYIPRYYLETLNYRELQRDSGAARHVRYKRALIGTYSGKKGYCVESRIRERLQDIQSVHGISFEQGRSTLVDTNIDFAIPSVQDPWVAIMSSFQETTSSGQTTKAKDMHSAYDRLQHINSRNIENRVFVNFVDGGGWLARKRDLERLVQHCDYFLNLANLDMLVPIVLEHVPPKYVQKR